MKSKAKYDTLIILGKDLNNRKSLEILTRRVVIASKLLNKNIKNIILSGGNYKRLFLFRLKNNTNSSTEAECLKKIIASKKKFKQKNIILENKSKTTFENAIYSFKIMNNKNLNSAIIIGSSKRYTQFFFFIANFFSLKKIKFKVIPGV